MDTYKVPKWAVSQTVRETGLWEDICKHGVGHPNAEYLSHFDPKGQKAMGVHGCCGCCVNHDQT